MNVWLLALQHLLIYALKPSNAIVCFVEIPQFNWDLITALVATTDAQCLLFFSSSIFLSMGSSRILGPPPCFPLQHAWACLNLLTRRAHHWFSEFTVD